MRPSLTPILMLPPRSRTLATQRSEVLDHMSECSESSMNNVDLEMVDHGRWNIIAGALNEIGNFYVSVLS